MKRFIIISGIIGLVIAGLVYSFDWGAKNSKQSENGLNINVGLIKNQYPSLYTEAENANNNSTNSNLSNMTIDPNKKYVAKLITTAGEMEIELNASKTPVTVNNFVSLAKNNFYNNTIFHRVIKDFMIQGGDPKGDGTGGPGYKFNDEPFEGEYGRGAVAMANSGPNTNGSQFFIMHANYPLPKKYVIFGKVTSGLDVLDKIAAAPVENNGMGENSKPLNPVRVNSVEILEK